MKIYFLRHGPAAERASWSGDDSERPLTGDGASRIEQEAQALLRGGFCVDSIAASPCRRALQSAEIVARVLAFPDPLRIDPRLGPGMDLPLLREALGEFPDRESVLLVGHEPDMSAAIGELIGGGRLDLKKGSLACVAVKNAAKGRGELLWLLPPAFLTGRMWK